MKLRLTLSEKLGLGFIFLVAMPLLGSILFGFLLYNSALLRIRQLVQITLPGERIVRQIERSSLDLVALREEAVFYLQKNNLEKFNERKELISRRQREMPGLLETYKNNYAISGERGREFLTGTTRSLADEEREKIAILERAINDYLKNGSAATKGEELFLLRDVAEKSSVLSAHLQRVVGVEAMPQTPRVPIFMLLSLWFLILGLSAGLVLYLFRRVTWPLEGLSEAASIIAEGKEYPLPQRRGEDEVAKLFTAVASMKDHLAQNVKELEKDIEERKKTEKALELAYRDVEDEKAKSEALLSSIGDGVIAVDRPGKIIFMNERAAKMLGRTISEFSGKEIRIIPIEDAGGRRLLTEERPLSKALETGHMISLSEYYFVRSNNSRFPAAITVSPVFLGGKIAGAIMVFRDITREKGIDRAKTEFISIASHQLRSPLSAVKWILEVLLEGRLTKTQKERIQDVHQSNERLIRIVSDLLSVSRIETGKFLLRFQLIDVGGFLNVMIKMLEPAAKAKKQEIRFSIEEGAKEAEVDTMRFGEAFKNVLDNAITYATEHSVIYVGVSAEGGMLVVGVHNTGPVISEEEHERIFTKFYRSEWARRQKPEGSGLGLFIAKSAIEAHGGRIWVESDESKGTTFFIRVPLRQKAGLTK